MRAGAQAVPTAPTGKETLVWSDEFNGNVRRGQPDPAKWTYDTGSSGWGNKELETYCAWGSNASPCTAEQPSAYLLGDGYLHIVARKMGDGVYSSARLKTQSLHGFLYGRIEARIRIPVGQGIWPAFWMLGDSIAAVGWPACGELDIMENIGKTPSTVYGSIHAPGGDLTKSLTLPDSQTLGEAFHVYGMIWSPGRVQFYFDNPSNVYARYTPADLPKGAIWPFDTGKFFILLNVAVGGNWPGNPDSSTKFPQEMLVDYVRVYAEGQDSPKAAAEHSSVREILH
ncbi:secreted hydrolase [Acidisarcina polymorpha]|uniref:Secreted hydrolase n=1 Tax=Acidisarcina polymorpha TaxID=2211140 RepID=A0A2Z5FVC2_9BACT|nr:secreted hydrolase [Acidisarcina polymorpha]